MNLHWNGQSLIVEEVDVGLIHVCKTAEYFSLPVISLWQICFTMSVYINMNNKNWNIDIYKIYLFFFFFIFGDDVSIQITTVRNGYTCIYSHSFSVFSFTPLIKIERNSHKLMWYVMPLWPSNNYCLKFS